MNAEGNDTQWYKLGRPTGRIVELCRGADRLLAATTALESVIFCGYSAAS